MSAVCRLLLHLLQYSATSDFIVTLVLHGCCQFPFLTHCCSCYCDFVVCFYCHLISFLSVSYSACTCGCHCCHSCLLVVVTVIGVFNMPLLLRMCPLQGGTKVGAQAVDGTRYSRGQAFAHSPLKMGRHPKTSAGTQLG